MASQQGEDKLQGRNVWRGVATLKAELLLWFILQERLNTKDRLRKLNCIMPSDSLSCLCADEIESVAHLFISCPVTFTIRI